MLLPWFIYLLVQLGYLQSTDSWHSLNNQQKQELEEIIIIDDF
jgi:hypothetical protein